MIELFYFDPNVNLSPKLLRNSASWPPSEILSPHVVTSCNNLARCCVEMLRTFGQAFKVVDQSDIKPKKMVLIQQ